MVVAEATIIFVTQIPGQHYAKNHGLNAKRKSQTRILSYVLSSTMVVKEKIASADNACDAHHNASVLRTLAPWIIPS
jgi:hypothetical protein